MPTLAAPNRYAHLIEADELKKYTETFAAYDRDGGGEVDSLELVLLEPRDGANDLGQAGGGAHHRRRRQ